MDISGDFLKIKNVYIAFLVVAEGLLTLWFRYANTPEERIILGTFMTLILLYFLYVYKEAGRKEKDTGFKAIIEFKNEEYSNINFTKPGKWYAYNPPNSTKSIDSGDFELVQSDTSGAWLWKLPDSVKSDTSIKIEIKDDNDQKWKVSRKIPSITLQAIKEGDNK